MPTPTKGPRLGGSPTHERMILAGLASQLFEHGRITTTETKAKRMRPLAEKLITKAKRGDLHARRLVLSTIHDKSVVHKLFTEIAPAVAEREGGYLRITKIGNRKGDNAPMATVELVTESVADGRAAKDKVAKKASKPAAAKPAVKVEEKPAAEATETVVEPVEVPEASAAAVPAAETPVAEEATVVETNLAEAPVDEAPVKGEKPAAGSTSAEAVEDKPEA